MDDDYNEGSSFKIKEIFAFLGIIFILIQILSFISYDPYDISFYSTSPNNPILNYCGIVGVYLTFVFIFTFGFSIILSPLFLTSVIFKILKGLDIWGLLKWLLYFQLSMISLSIVLSINTFPYLDKLVSDFQITGSGGIIGSILGKEIFKMLLGFEGTNIFFGILFFISLQGLIPFSYIQLAKNIFRFSKYLLISLKFIGIKIYKVIIQLYKKIQGIDIIEEVEQSISDNQNKIFLKEEKPVEKTEEKNPESEKDEKNSLLNKIILKPLKPKEDINLKDARLPRKKTERWEFPSLELLKEPVKTNLDLEENIEANAKKLIQTLKEFDVESEIVGVESGPVITRYEIGIAAGIKVQKVTSLDNDIGLAMRAKSVRIIAPIPGKSAIGIEIPNQFRKTVFFKELLASQIFKNTKAEIPLVLGKDISGKPVIADLASMPHLLIAGATGSGKSVCINTIIMSLLYTLSPQEAKIMMVDPKKVELATYKNLPHMFVPLITNPNKVAMGLRCLIEEMEKRYQLFKEVEVRNIAGYNKRDKSAYRKKIKDEDPNIDPMEVVPEKLPFIVVLIDELADLMMVAKAEIESSIVRLAQLSRAVGIHMILATQRPSVDVVTGLIKANVPARIAFRVSARVDSRTVLDSIGAEKLLGQGDLLFLNPGNIDLYRVQGAYLDDNEINNVVEHWCAQGEPEYDDTALNTINQPEMTEGETDPLFNEAVETIRNSKQASTSYLQKQFRIGYNRASRLMDELEARGIVGPSATGGKTREIYLEDVK